MISVLIALAAASTPRPSHRTVRPAHKADRSAKLSGKLQGLFRSDDYPAGALDRDEQGKVDVRVKVNKVGTVSDCVVTKSSGFAALDTQTCRIIWMRGKFKPARDKRGRPIPSEAYGRITWQIAEADDEPVPADPWWARSIVTFAEGKAPVCRMETEGAAQKLTKQPDCPLEGSQPEGATPTATSLVELISEKGLSIGEIHKAGIAPTDRLIGKQVVEIGVDGAGVLSGCKLIERTGELPEDVPENQCSTMSKLFIPRKNASGAPMPFKAYLISVIYLRIEKVA
jgi:TonB family protein